MEGRLPTFLLGPVLVGVIINNLLFGVLIAQNYFYYTTYPRDRLSIKILVSVIFIFELFNAVMVTVFIYDALILHFGDFYYIQFANWYLMTVLATSGVIAVTVQLFYTWRIHVLIHNWFLTISVAFLSLGGGAASLVSTYDLSLIPAYGKFQPWDGSFFTWLGCTSIVDVIITVSLVFYLRRHRTGFERPDMIINRIIRFTVQTGMVTSVVAISEVIIALSHRTGVHLILNLALCKLYSNSLMSSLNSRQRWKPNQLSAEWLSARNSTLRFQLAETTDTSRT